MTDELPNTSNSFEAPAESLSEARQRDEEINAGRDQIVEHMIEEGSLTEDGKLVGLEEDPSNHEVTVATASEVKSNVENVNTELAQAKDRLVKIEKNGVITETRMSLEELRSFFA